MALLAGVCGNLTASAVTLKNKNQVEESFNTSNTTNDVADSNVFCKIVDRRTVLCTLLALGVTLLFLLHKSLQRNQKLREINLSDFKKLVDAVERYEKFANDRREWVDFLTEESSGFVPGFLEWVDDLEKNVALMYESRDGSAISSSCILCFLDLYFPELAFPEWGYRLPREDSDKYFRYFCKPSWLRCRPVRLTKNLFERYKNNFNISKNELNSAKNIIIKMAEIYKVLGYNIRNNFLLKDKCLNLCRIIVMLLRKIPSDFMRDEIISLKNRRLEKSSRSIYLDHFREFVLVAMLRKQLGNASEAFKESNPNISEKTRKLYVKGYLLTDANGPKYARNYLFDHYMKSFKLFDGVSFCQEKSYDDNYRFGMGGENVYSLYENWLCEESEITRKSRELASAGFDYNRL